MIFVLFFRELEESSDSDDDLEMSVISRGRHDIVIKHEFKKHGTGFFKQTKKQHAMFPFHEDKVYF